MDIYLLALLQSGLAPYTTPADDAYNFYGSKNPFETNGYGEDLLGDLGGKQPSGGKSVRFDGGSARGGGATPGLLAGPDARSGERKAQQQKEYASVLQQQMQEVGAQRSREETRERERGFRCVQLGML